MIEQGIQAFARKRILLLQGPVGPFFTHLSRSLRRAGAQVYKVNLNAGDWYFYPRHALNYRGSLEDWPIWLGDQLHKLNIDVVLLFGDCRPVHQRAHAVAAKLGLEIGVFEEGYVRPDHVTLERFGVNANSLLPRVPDAYKNSDVQCQKKSWSVGNTYWPMVWCGFRYFTAGALGKFFFPHYQHHRPLSLLEALPWIRSVWRKQWCKWVERGVEHNLITVFSHRYFLVPLQVFNDAQVTVHAKVGTNGDVIEHFIANTIRSFALYAPKDTLLVFKHHPMDRGYRDYKQLITQLADKVSLRRRILYIHDQHLPSLLEHARGVVVINSTVGLSALHHHAPTMVCGTAIYDMPGLTYQGTLDQFWVDAPKAKPQQDLYERFRNYLIATTQLNGSFYKPLKVPGNFAGLVWDVPPKGGQHTPGAEAAKIMTKSAQENR